MSTKLPVYIQGPSFFPVLGEGDLMYECNKFTTYVVCELLLPFCILYNCFLYLEKKIG